jgi:hypothetical protein
MWYTFAPGSGQPASAVYLFASFTVQVHSYRELYSHVLHRNEPYAPAAL